MFIEMLKWKKRNLFVVAMLVLSLMLAAGCSKKETENTEQKDQTEQSIVLPDEDLDEEDIQEDEKQEENKSGESNKKKEPSSNKDNSEDKNSEDKNTEDSKGIIELPVDEW